MRGLIHFQSKGRSKMSGGTCCVTSKLRLTLFLAVAIVVLQGVDAQAVPFSSDLTISGFVEYDTGFALADNTDTFGGSFSTTEGGGTSTISFGESGVTGDNPLFGTLTDIGDGFGMTAGSTGEPVSEFGIGLDLWLDITNTSATTDYWITFELDFSNFVDSVGSDVYVDSEFTLFDPVDEIFFTDLVTDTLEGNEVGGVPTGGYGGPLADSGIFTFTMFAGPGDSLFLDGALTIEGGAYGCHYVSDFSADITVVDVVPVPGALLLGSIGLGYAGCLLRRFKSRD